MAAAAPGSGATTGPAVVTEFPVAVSAAAKTAPHTDGRSVVWSDARNAAAAIYSSTSAPRAESLIAGAGGDLATPTVSDGAIYWTDLSAANSVVAGHDPCATTTT